MIEFIKRVTIEIVRDLQQRKVEEVDIIQLTSLLQQRIIINVSVGPGFSDRVIDFECKYGKVVKSPIHVVIYDIILNTLSRHDQLLFVILPFLTQYAITPRDRRDQRMSRLYVASYKRLLRRRRSLVFGTRHSYRTCKRRSNQR